MKKTRTGLLNTKNALMAGAALITLTAGVTQKAEAATGSGTIGAVLLTAIVVDGTVDLHFGSFTDSGAGGTVVMDVADGRTTTGATTAVTGSIPATSGVISVTAATGLAIDLSITGAPGATFTVSDGLANTMVVSAFNIDTNAGGDAAVVTLAAATETFPLGATLTVGAAQVAGTYAGTYDLVANYQ